MPDLKAKCLLRDASGKPVWRYTHSSETNVALTIRREQKRLAALKAAKEAKGTARNVAPIRKVAK